MRHPPFLILFSFLLAFALLWPEPAAAQPPQPPRRARVYFQTRAQLNALANELDIWEVHQAQGYLVAPLTPEQARALEARGLRVTLSPPLTQRLYLGFMMLPGHEQNTIPGYACYRTVETTYRDLANLAAAHPQLAQWQDIGDSWEKVTSHGQGGYDIHALILTNRQTPGPKPRLLILAAIHAREYATAELATRFAESLVQAYGQDPDITWLLNTTELHIIPIANPDGRKRAETGLLWRKNTNQENTCTANRPPWRYYGVDLNRNSSFLWNHGGSSDDPCSEVYRGAGPASEPEVQAIEAYIRSLFPDQRGPGNQDPAPPDATGLVISLHSYGRYVLFPWDWTEQDAPNKTDLQTLGRKFGFFNGYQVCSDCLYNASGTTTDFAYGELGLAAYTFELGNDFFQDCQTFEQVILPRNMPALRYALKVAQRPYQWPHGPDALDLSLTPSSPQAGEPITLSLTLDDTRYASGGYGHEPTQPITAGYYALDPTAWPPETTIPLTARDGAFDSAHEEAFARIDPSTLTPGRHLVLVGGQDAQGAWGPPTALFLDIPQPPSANLIPRPPR